MAETAISGVLSKLGELAAKEATIQLEVGDNMAQLRDRLEWLQAFVRDADRKRRAGTDQLTRVWVRQTRDVAFEADDALDEFYEVDLENKGYHWWELCHEFLTNFYTQIVVRHRLSNQIKKINTRLDDISKNQKEYKIEHTLLAPMTSSTIAFSAWQDDAVGFENDVKALKKMLVQGEDSKGQNLKFISILGESGAGKYTLVDKIYFGMKDEITNKFDVKVWYMMPPGSSTEHLLRVIYERVEEQVLTWQAKKDALAEGIPDEIRRLLDLDLKDEETTEMRKRKYLLVVSGISSKAMFNCLRACLPDDACNGSRVVLVLDIESDEVAQRANTMNPRDDKDKKVINGIYLLSRLDKERSGELFCARAFAKEVRQSHHSDEEKKLKSMYSGVVHAITGGHPLAIVLLAGLLRFKERPGQWEAVLQQLMSSSSAGHAAAAAAMDDGGGNDHDDKQGEGAQASAGSISEGAKEKQAAGGGGGAAAISSRRTTIERVFWESFENLADGLKSCLLYFAAQPKDTAWTPDTIVRMWMAEGFIKAHNGKTVEEVGHNYLKELTLRCLVHSFYTNDAVGTKGVQVHRSLHGFLLSEAREAGFMEVHETQDDFIPSSVRRLSSYISDGGFTTFANKFSKLRSFLCWARDDSSSGDDDAAAAGSINVNKNLDDLKFLLRSKFLRVIEIKGLRIEELPAEICDMFHLRYLGVHSKGLKKLPPTIAKLLNLQTLDIRGTAVKEIHPSFWNIKTLRHVLAQDLKLPASSSIDQQLDGLQTLQGVRPGTEGDEGWDQGNCPLHKMTELHTLCLHGIKSDKHGAELGTALLKMHLLRHLELRAHGFEPGYNVNGPDEFSPCIFKDRGLQNLETVKLYGVYRLYLHGAKNLRLLRPNLALVDLYYTFNSLPDHIEEEFKKMGVKGRWLKINKAWKP